MSEQVSSHPVIELFTPNLVNLAVALKGNPGAPQSQYDLFSGDYECFRNN